MKTFLIVIFLIVFASLFAWSKYGEDYLYNRKVNQCIDAFNGPQGMKEVLEKFVTNEEIYKIRTEQLKVPKGAWPIQLKNCEADEFEITEKSYFIYLNGENGLVIPRKGFEEYYQKNATKDLRHDSGIIYYM